MRLLITTFLCVLLRLPLQCSARWLGIPTVPFTEAHGGGSFSLRGVHSIIVDQKYQNHVDNDGETLIPPTLLQFSQTFSQDLQSTFNLRVPVITGRSAAPGSVFVTLGNPNNFRDAAGRPTSEGYEIQVTRNGITITGASPLGAWWGTRSILQQGVLNKNLELSLGTAKDAPGWSIRGAFLDCGRHYYPPEFLVEMCSYLSYFKQNTFHVHLSDNLNVNVNLSAERKMELYSAFRLNTGNPELAGLNKRLNESYTRADIENIQQQCASRGVTIIPEIEAPGHALVITQWKPELALEPTGDTSLLNISHPETIPTMQMIWDATIPWFHSKTVHLGADEYSSSAVPEYNRFVNTMHSYIGEKYSKKVRIWGTFTPNAFPNETNVNTNVSIQHWEFFEDNPYHQYIQNGYQVLNSDDAFYMVNKWSGSYPQQLNITRVFHGAPDGGPYAPNIFDTKNSSNNPARDNPNVLGHMPALWNDFGPNASSVYEAYYCFRDGLPALGDKQWGGDLLMSEYYDIFPTLHAAIPDQNLDLSIPSRTSTILSYDFTRAIRTLRGAKVSDKSGNKYDGTISGRPSISKNGLKLEPGVVVSTPLTSKGRNYTLSFDIQPLSSTPGPLFSSPDTSLLVGNGSISNVAFVTGGNAYVLNYTLPLHVWSSVKVIGLSNATYFSVTEAGKREKVYEFTSKIGTVSSAYVWNNPMGIEAPLQTIGGGKFEGYLRSVELVNEADAKYAAFYEPLVTGPQ
ncbi:beta-hexosaminidase [Xylogone sp. PMI_703]|nr:beta-hexosaminidase [Xylogone sp. PMI_703]